MQRPPRKATLAKMSSTELAENKHYYRGMHDGLQAALTAKHGSGGSVDLLRTASTHYMGYLQEEMRRHDAGAAAPQSEDQPALALGAPQPEKN